MEAKVTAANTRSGNQLARCALRTRCASSRVLDSSRRGSSAGYAVSVVMGNRLAIQTHLHNELALPRWPRQEIRAGLSPAPNPHPRAGEPTLTRNRPWFNPSTAHQATDLVVRITSGDKR